MGNKQSTDDSRRSISCVSPAEDEAPYGTDGDEVEGRVTLNRKRSRKDENRSIRPPPRDLNDYYNMNHNRRGIFIIISNRNVKGLPPRTGAEEEVKQLERIFEKFNFEVRCMRDLSKSEVLTEMKKVALEDHRQCDCFAMAVLTHGDEMDTLKAKEGTYYTQQLYNMFNSKACASLQGKPKIFFFNACKGNKDDSVDSPCVRQVAYNLGNPQFYKKEEIITSHTYSDFLFGYSTWEGYKSYRHQKEGSLYIRYLSEELAEGAKRGDDLTTILTRVTRRLSEKPAMDGNKILRQTSYYQSSLTKKVILQPKRQR
ncbi:caspase-6-like [Ischnura elegans]|uniref:caspase-6-like n=1 Tax=Ischnura elegans TaxID=197161 RepID=UPI001ED8BC85|nr:caspase-6-like [Ischnura elegans]